VIVIANSTPLIALAEVEKLELLRELFEQIIIPESVYHEVVV
jgi:predicted nucleic acid-binding protein